MSDDKLNIELVGAEQLMAQLNAAAAALDEPYALLDAIGTVMEGNIRLRMDLKMDAAGHAWAPLTQSTLESYARKYPGGIPGSLLQRHTPGMHTSLTHNTTPDMVEVGFSVPYAGYHVTGTKHMVRRDPIFGTVSEDGTQGTLGAQDQQDILDVIEGSLRGLLG